MQTRLLGATALVLVAAVNLSSARAEGPKPSGGNLWSGISQPVDHDAVPSHSANPSFQGARPQGTSQKGFLDLPFDPEAAAIKPITNGSTTTPAATHIGRDIGSLLWHPFNLLLLLTLLTISSPAVPIERGDGPCQVPTGAAWARLAKSDHSAEPSRQWRVKCLQAKAARKSAASWRLRYPPLHRPSRCSGCFRSPSSAVQRCKIVAAELIPRLASLP